MDKAQRKAMIEEWKNRSPEMGVIALRCRETGESFLGASKNIPAEFNGLRVKLSSGTYPNKKLSALWKQYGEEGFEFLVLERAECEDPTKDYTAKLEELREKYLAADPKAEKIWR
ncbi:MAG: GIY-YIG nuclease family protein [Oscillospiraceae bacterium]|nr:GIY-YIG nuclease family protein [Oscillospiraceae bacterium]